MGLMTNTKELISERRKTYGDFSMGVDLEACIMRSMENAYRVQTGSCMNDTARVGISKIVMKMSRLATSPFHKDTWDDIAGYAQLMSDHFCDKESYKYPREKKAKNDKSK